MTPATAKKLQEMQNGKAVILSDDDCDALFEAGHGVRTAFNTKQVGMLDRYVGWMTDEGKPANLKYDDYNRAFAST